MAASALSSVGALAVFFAANDLVRISDAFQAQRVSRHELINVRDVLSRTASCVVIAQSDAIADGLHLTQRYKPLEYAEVLTGCRIMNGSFVQRGATEGRALDGLPTAAALAALPADTAVFLVVPESVEARYRAHLPDAEFARQSERIGPLPVWRIRARSP